MENMKFRITSPEQSERLQNVLFGMGYGWLNYGGIHYKVEHTDKPFIYVENDIEYGAMLGYSSAGTEDFFVEYTDCEERDTEAFIAQHTVFKVIDEPATTKRNKYSRQIKQDVWVDVYDVLEAFKVTSPTLQHLTKKALCAGLRGHKDERQDLVDILDSAKRALEMYDNKVTE